MNRLFGLISRIYSVKGQKKIVDDLARSKAMRIAARKAYETVEDIKDTVKDEFNNSNNNNSNKSNKNNILGGKKRVPDTLVGEVFQEIAKDVRHDINLLKKKLKKK